MKVGKDRSFDLMDEILFLFLFQERLVQFWPRPRLKLKLFASWLQL